jgi:hypothetical protein
MKRRNFLIGTIAFGLATIWTACRDKDGRMSEGTKVESLDNLSRELKLAFPPGTRLVGVLRDSGMDDSIRVKVEMRSPDFPGFLSSTPIHAESLSPGAGGRLGPDHGFWDPHRARGLRSAQATLEGEEYRVLNIGVGEAGPDVVAVYIVNHGM